eukprot:11601657-Alexandrium_andersonii.AAC.1
MSTDRRRGRAAARRTRYVCLARKTVQGHAVCRWCDKGMPAVCRRCASGVQVVCRRCADGGPAVCRWRAGGGPASAGINLLIWGTGGR